MRGITFRDWLIEDLTTLERNRFAVEQLHAELRTLEAKFTAIKATDYDKIPGGSGDNVQEEKMLTLLAKREELEADLKATTLHVEYIDRLLASLPEDEALVIDKMLVKHQRDAVAELMQTFNCEKSQVYRIRDRALKNLAISRFGRGYRP